MFWYVWLMSGISWGGWAWSGLDYEANWWGNTWGKTTPSLSPYSDLDLPETLDFTNAPGIPWSNTTPQSLTVTVYTDQPRLWKEIRYQSVMRLARWYLARCQIQMNIPKIRRLPPGILTSQDGLVQWQIPLDLTVTREHRETLIFLTRHVDYIWGAGTSRQRYRLLGVSSTVRLQNRPGRWIQRPAVWVRASPVFTTLVHELGHRLGLPHIVSPYRLMLTGSGVRSSLPMLWTSLLGYMDPQRFVFSSQECQTMHKTLRRERKP